MALTITESWICERVNLQHDNLDDVKSLSLPGSYHEKIVHLGNSLRGFTRLKHLDLSRNDISVLDGLDHLKLLETLNLYYNSVTNLKELYKLRYNSNLKEIDLRLNPVTKNEPDYRLFVIHMTPNIRVLDDRSVRDTERKAALSHFVSDQASEFDHQSPQKRDVRDQKPERTSSSARVEMVNNLASRPSVLADDDIALIDLISKTDVSNDFGSSNQGRKYKAETYHSGELKEIPSPHAEKYAQFHSNSSHSSRPKSREKLRVNFQDELIQGTSEYNDYQPFVTNGNFTPNPGTESRSNQQKTEAGVENSRRTVDSARNSANPKDDYLPERSRQAKHASLSSKISEESSEMERKLSQINRYLNEKSHSQPRVSTSRHQDDKGQTWKKNKDELSSSADVGDEETLFRSKNIGSREKLFQEKMDVESDYEKSFLTKVLCLVDKYWNGSKSLQTNAKFQSLAKDVISKFLADNPRNSSEQKATTLKKDLAARDKEITELHALLREREAEKEKMKRRLQNEEEIQRTIEMTDQDLRRLQQKIEEVQAENKLLKSNQSSAESEREVIGNLRAENEELRRFKIASERENQTLIQQCEQHSTTLTQLQELTSMLQESHRSLVVTNDHLLQELDETRQRHQHEVQQLHWSFEQYKKTAEWLPRKAK